MPTTFPGELRGAGLRVVVLVARWNPDITTALRDGALEVLAAAGTTDVVVLEVPGAYELPQAAAAVLASDPGVGAVLALGCLIRGETSHDRVLADAVAVELLRVATTTRVPIAFGVITADTLAQARARSTDADAAGASGHGGHKGREAAEAALRLADVLHRFREHVS